MAEAVEQLRTLRDRSATVEFNSSVRPSTETVFVNFRYRELVSITRAETAPVQSCSTVSANRRHSRRAHWTVSRALSVSCRQLVGDVQAGLAEALDPRLVQGPQRFGVERGTSR